MSDLRNGYLDLVKPIVVPQGIPSGTKDGSRRVGVAPTHRLTYDRRVGEETDAVATEGGGEAKTEV